MKLYKEVLVWDPENAFKYYVRRSLIQRIIYPKDFATLGESIRKYEDRKHWFDRPMWSWWLRLLYLMYVLIILFVIYVVATTPYVPCPY